MGKVGILLATVDTLYGNRTKEDGKNYLNLDKEKDILGETLFQILMGGVNSSQQSKNRTDGDSAEPRYAEIAEELKKADYRSMVLERWKARITKPRPKFKEECKDILDDALYKDIIEETDEYKLVEFLKKHSSTEEIEEQVQFLTTITLMSITRHHWHEVVSCLLPKNETDFPIVKTPEEVQFEQGQESFDLGDYKKAIEYFENAWYEEGIDNSWSGNVYYMLSRCYRLLIDQAVENGTEYDKYVEVYKYNLIDACSYFDLNALLSMADEYCGNVRNPVFDISYEDAANKYKEVINRTADMPIVGEKKAKRGAAFWALYQLIINKFYEPVEGESAEDFLKKAKECGDPKATEAYLSAKESRYVSLGDYLEESDDTSTGIFWINDQNSLIYTVIQKTKPIGWNEVYLTTNDASGAVFLVPGNIRKKNQFISFKAIMEHYSETAQRYLLVGDNFYKNLADLLELLRTIKENYSSSLPDIEIFIRGEEEKVSPIIDTAISHMGRILCKVHIIDDDKNSARVLARHPLFYPIRNKAKDATMSLHYVIIGSTACCQWLLREAFWMLTFRNENITTYITMIAPDAQETLNKILYQCPGMKPALEKHSKRTENEITKNFPYIDAINMAYDSNDAIDKIREIVNTDYTYVSIDTGSDIDNMYASIRVREEVLNIGIDKNNWEKINDTVITFRCKDPNVCVLSRNSIVLVENKGDSWNTNYAIIPFGSYDEEYQWDELMSNLYEKIGFNNHLQYNYEYYTDIASNDDKFKDAYDDFWGKTYNRDSSIAVALSMPYRLFQADYFSKGRIMPSSDWKITDRTTYYTESAFYKLAEQFPPREALKKFYYNDWNDDNGKYHEKLILGSSPELMARWEKERWNRFMLSRGWRTANETQVGNYYDAGNMRQQLYIGKMHPCITTYDKLYHLESFWKGKTGTAKNFRQLDISNLEMTRAILQMAWTRSLERKKDKGMQEK